MRIRLAAVASILALAIGAAPVASGAPSDVTKLRRTQLQAQGGSCDAAGNCSEFSVWIYEDLEGVTQGVVSSSYRTPSTTLSYVTCRGPAYANAASLNPGNGRITLSATLNPSSADCSSFNASTVVINLTGNPDGTVHTMTEGTSRTELPSLKESYSFRTEMFGESFVGTNGYTTGSFGGWAEAMRTSESTKAK
ncbi:MULTISPECIES: hypothetical protein [unclassified Variovorax]|uniref:hypothetical protein n=1 Tax=unclassified Variovorax TaxID=663243 RepID=UPI00076C899C|nr:MULTISPECIES: hypothetical protein [unclassified Variovorax]KWT96957.1 hypothetical protein APY03_1959 [Variovorax sp. WDL1]PNG58514.1 hypothetical protein CHC07_00239 [Variovorax sp. B4]PNG61696.1 hypothetical protein CHC06_01597 [Variovorax sp. B2]VTV12256.1 hypothetical protein WDL1CHR_03068 [Variovorax sp. WDL1]